MNTPGAPIYVTESASHAHRKAKRYATERGYHYAQHHVYQAQTPEREHRTLTSFGTGITLITWNRTKVPCYRPGDENACGERWTTIYKVWAVHPDPLEEPKRSTPLSPKETEP